MSKLSLSSPLPNFVPGQTLTAEKLNAIHKYLEPQDLATRVALIGAGIFYGLELKADKAPNELTVSPGAGVSSEGYLFFIECDPLVNEKGKSFYFNGTRKIPFKTLNKNVSDSVGNTEADILEWTLTAPNPVQAFPAGVKLEEYCFILFFEEIIEGDTSCFASFNENGSTTKYELKLLALKSKDLSAIWLTKTQSGGPNNTSTPQFPYVRRLPLWSLIKDLKPIPIPGNNDTLENVAWTELYNSYFDLCREALFIDDPSQDGPVVKALRAVLPGINFDDLKSLINLFDSNKKYEIQYLHDYLKDLIAAYEEWTLNKPEEAKALWCPNSKEFPTFIALGALPSADGSATAQCRMPRYYPGIPNSSTIAPIDPYFERLKFMATIANLNFFSLSNDKAEVKITGAWRKSPPLSEQAIPFYYKNNADLRKLWHPVMAKVGRSDAIPSYFPHPANTNKPFDQVLSYDLEQVDFFRIEGHIGKSLKEGLSKIQALRQELNLPFKIVALRIDTAAKIVYQPDPNDDNREEILGILNQMQFSTFAKNHPGMEHMGGVPKGGTFIIVFQQTLQDNFEQELFDLFVINRKKDRKNFVVDYLKNVLQRRIVADFCLPYGCYEGPNIEYCFSETNDPPPLSDFEVQEISYYWDDNNIAIAKVELENRSQFADQFKWYIDIIQNDTYTRLDVNGDGVLDDDDFFDDSDTLTLKFNLAVVQKILVRLHALKTGQPEDTSEQVIELCPPEISLEIVDSLSENFVEEITLELPADNNPVTINLVFDPPGGLLSADNQEFSQRISRRGPKEAIVSIDANLSPGTYHIRYYFCSGQDQQVRITLIEGGTEEISRSAEFIANVEAVADENLTPTSSYQRTLNFLRTPHPSVEEAVKDFGSLTRLLLGNIGTPGGASDEQYAALLRNATWNLLDKAVAFKPVTMPEPLQTALENLVPALQKVRVDVDALRKGWNSKAIRNNENAKLIKSIEAILRPS